MTSSASTVPAPVQSILDAAAAQGVTVVPVNAASAAFVVVGCLDGTVDVQQFGGLSQEDVAHALVLIASELTSAAPNVPEDELLGLSFTPDELLELAGALADARPIHTPDLDRAMRTVSMAADAVVNADRDKRHG